MDRVIILMILVIAALMTWNIWLQDARTTEKCRHREAMAKLAQTVRNTEAENARLKARIDARDSHREYLADSRLGIATEQIADLERRNTVLKAINTGLLRTRAWPRP